MVNLLDAFPAMRNGLKIDFSFMIFSFLSFYLFKFSSVKKC